MNNFLQRSLTGVLFVSAIVGSLILSPLTFLFVFLVIVLVGIFEMDKMLSQKGIEIQFFSALLIGVFAFVSCFLVQSGISSYKIFFTLIPLVASVFIYELFVVGKDSLSRIAFTLFTALYVGVPFGLFSFLLFFNGHYDYALPLLLFALIWINDTGAYVTGVSIGKHRIHERISPKKTWEGTIGGLVFTVVAAILLAQFHPQVSVIHWGIVGALVSVMAFLGDLVESMIKRYVDIKDSGSFLPGHGGVLDRFDSVLFVVPMVLFYLTVFV